MIDINEFLTLTKLPLDIRVVNYWLNDVDDAFVDYIVARHHELDYQHLRSAMQLLQNVNRDDVREFFGAYADHENKAYRMLARGSLDLQRERGWIPQTAR